jgi:hypothetical protein
MSGAERQRRYMANLLDGKSSVTKPAKPDNAKDREIAALKARIRELEAELVSPAPMKPEPDRKDERTAKLEKERDEAIKRCWDLHAYLELRTKGVFTRTEFKKLQSFFHPDRVPKDEAERKRFTEAFNLISRCEKLLKEEPLPEPPPMTKNEWLEGRLRVLKENRARGLKAAATRARKKAGRQIASNN